MLIKTEKSDYFKIMEVKEFDRKEYKELIKMTNSYFGCLLPAYQSVSNTVMSIVIFQPQGYINMDFTLFNHFEWKNRDLIDILTLQRSPENEKLNMRLKYIGKK